MGTVFATTASWLLRKTESTVVLPRNAIEKAVMPAEVNVLLSNDSIDVCDTVAEDDTNATPAAVPGLPMRAPVETSITSDDNASKDRLATVTVELLNRAP